MSTFRPVILVPHYEHVQQFEASLPELMELAVPLLVVDDGSDTDTFARLRSLAREHGFKLIRRAENGGKGAAVMDGFAAAAERGYTHAVQVDADGQHHLPDIERLLEASQRHPAAMVCGRPVFGDDMPAERRWGRKVTDFFVMLETWSLRIEDAMCGLRVYPLDETLRLMADRKPGRRMDFDTDIIVRADWAGMPLRFLPTEVRYPEGGVSHFHYVRDNIDMTAMHARLMAGMLWRIPTLVRRTFGRNEAGGP